MLTDGTVSIRSI